MDKKKRDSIIGFLARDLIDKNPPKPPEDRDIERLKKRVKIHGEKG